MEGEKKKKKEEATNPRYRRLHVLIIRLTRYVFSVAVKHFSIDWYLNRGIDELAARRGFSSTVYIL